MDESKYMLVRVWDLTQVCIEELTIKFVCID
jgi:hypothetical protein